MSILRKYNLLTFSIRSSPACCSASLPQGPSLRPRMHHPLAQAKSYLPPRPKRAGQEEGPYTSSGRGRWRIRRHVCMILVTLFSTSACANWKIRLALLTRSTYELEYTHGKSAHESTTRLCTVNLRVSALKLHCNL
jgi:hypothetical protein